MTGAQYRQTRLEARLVHHDLGLSRTTLWRIEQSDSVALRHVLALQALAATRHVTNIETRLASLGLI